MNSWFFCFYRPNIGIIGVHQLSSLCNFFKVMRKKIIELSHNQITSGGGQLLFLDLEASKQILYLLPFPFFLLFTTVALWLLFCFFDELPTPWVSFTLFWPVQTVMRNTKQNLSFILIGLVIEPAASQMLSKCSTTELHIQSSNTKQNQTFPSLLKYFRKKYPQTIHFCGFYINYHMRYFPTFN